MMDLHSMKMESPKHEKHHVLNNLIGSYLPPVMVMHINLAFVRDFSGKHMVLIAKLLRLDSLC